MSDPFGRGLAEASPYRRHQFLEIERLVEDARKMGCVQIVGLFAGDDDDRHPFRETLSGHLAQHVAPMEARQSQIEDDRRRRVRLEILQRVQSITDSDDGVALGL